MIYSKAVDYALLLAQVAHNAQKYNQMPYIEHVREVMTVCLRLTNDEDVLISAALHDVVEDTAFTIEAVKHFFNDQVAFAIDCLTRRPEESYWDYLDRVSHSQIAVIVKFADAYCNRRAIDRPDCPLEKRSLASRYDRVKDMLWPLVKKTNYVNVDTAYYSDIY